MKSVLLWSVLLWAAAPQSPSPPAAQSPSRTVWDGVYTEAQAKRGEVVGHQCQGCHGLDVNSGEPGPWMYGNDFAARYDGKTMEDLVRRLNTMPPDNPGSLAPTAVADFAAYVLWANEFPAGARELPADVAALNLIRIAVRKP